MLKFLRENIQFIFILLIWLAAGAFGSIFAFAVIPIFLFLLFSSDRYQELFLGFLFMLILSDSLIPSLEFAKSFKNMHIILFAFFFFLKHREFAPVNKLFVLFIPYFIIALFCLIFAEENLFSGVQKTISYILLFISVPSYITHVYRIRGNEFLRDLISFLVIIIIAGFLLRFYNAEFAFSHGGRLRGIFGNPNGLGIFLILTFLIFSIVDKYNPDLFTIWEKRIIYLVLIYVTYKTGSRTALVAIVLFLLFARFYRYSPFLGFILFIGAIVGTEYFLANYALIITALGLQDVFRLDTLEAGSGRTVAWEFAWENIKQSIFLGKGFAYDEHLMRSNFDFLSRLGHEGGVHNTYLIIWLNTGIIGLMAFLRGFILLFIRASKTSLVAIPAMFAIMFSINFEPWLAASLNPFTILFLTMITILTDEDIIAGREVSATTNTETDNEDEKAVESLA